MIYAQQILQQLRLLFEEICNGCFLGNSSKTRNFCSISTEEQHLTICFNAAFKRVNTKTLMKKWLEEISTNLLIPDEIINSLQRQMLTYQTYPRLYNDIYKIVLNMLKLEYRFI